MRVTYEQINNPQFPRLDRYTSVGGYTIVYYSEDGSTLCSDCATDELIDPDRTDERMEADTYDEGAPIACEGCGALIESSYGDPSVYE